MDIQHHSILTTAGAEYFAQAIATGTPVIGTEFLLAVGDGGGQQYEPDASQTNLVAEKWRGKINDIYTNENDASQVIVEGIVPTSVGGWFIREWGVYNKEGMLIAVGSMDDTYKSVLSSGIGKQIIIQAILDVENSAVLELVIDESVVIATRSYVDGRFNKLAEIDGTKLVGRLGNQPLVAVSYFKNNGMSDQDAVQAAFDSGLNVFFDVSVTLSDYITMDRSVELSLVRSPGVKVYGEGYLPVLRTNPAHVAGGSVFRQSKTRDPKGSSYKRVFSHQTLATEMSVNDVTTEGVVGENFVSLYSGIESFNCEQQRMWAINTVTNAHGIKSGDEIYGGEVDMNADGNITSGGHFVGWYIAGIGDVSTCANSDGIRVQRLRNGVDKWTYGIRVFDAVTGVAIIDAKNYSIYAEGTAPIVRRKTTQDGGWSFLHQVSASFVAWGVDDYGDIYVRKLFVGAGNGKSKNRVNIDGGMSFYSTNQAVVWGAIPVGGYSEKDVTALFGITRTDWAATNLTVTPMAFGATVPNISVIVFFNSSKTQAFVRISNIGTSALAECNVGLNAVMTSHSFTN